jgi:hypothetical protein
MSFVRAQVALGMRPPPQIVGAVSLSGWQIVDMLLVWILVVDEKR